MNHVAGNICLALLLGSKEARWTGTAVMEIEEGKFLKTWINSDSISALIQLGRGLYSSTSQLNLSRF